MKRHGGFQILSSLAKDTTEMPPMGGTPTNAAQARGLAPLKDQPDVAREVMGQLLRHHTCKNGLHAHFGA